MFKTESIAMALLRISALFLMMLLVSGLSSCGKTGSLYLPTEQTEAKLAE